jgi:molybdopterin synthase sulfur carrier subunit
MPVVWVPAQMRDLTGRQARVRMPGATVRQVVDNLDALFPGVRARLCEDGEDLSPYLTVVVDGQPSRMRLLAPVGEDSEVHFVAAMQGG